MKNLNKFSNVICGVVFLGVILYYFIYICSHSFNVNYATDDLIVFLDQHMAYKDKGPSHLLQYLVSISKYPHPKISTRIFAFISEGFTGQINFRLIQVLGNFGFLFLLLTIRKVLDLKWDFVKLLPFTLLFFVPIVNTFWTISIASLPWLFILLLLAIYYFVNEKPFAALVFTFLTVFASGQGFLVLPLIGVIILERCFRNKKLLKPDLIWMAGGIIISILYYFVVISIKTDSAGNGIISAILNNVDDQQSLGRIKTFFSFFAVYPLRSMGDYNFAKNTGAITGALLFLLLLFLSYKTFRKTDNKTSLVFFCYSIFFVLMGILSVYTSLSSSLEDQFTIPGRYEIHSIMFLASLFALSFACLPKSKYVKYIILGIALFFYIQKAPKNYRFYDHVKDRHLDELHFTLGQNLDKVEFSEYIYSTLIKSKLQGLYKIPAEILVQKIDDPGYPQGNKDLVSLENTVLEKTVIVDRFFEDEYFIYLNWYTLLRKNSKDTLEQYFLLVDEENRTEHYFSPYYSNKITRKERIKFASKKRKNTKPIYTGALIEKSLLSHLSSTYAAYAVVIIEEEEIRIPLRENIKFGD